MSLVHPFNHSKITLCYGNKATKNKSILHIVVKNLLNCYLQTILFFLDFSPLLFVRHNYLVPTIKKKNYFLKIIYSERPKRL